MKFARADIKHERRLPIKLFSRNLECVEYRGGRNGGG